MKSRSCRLGLEALDDRSLPSTLVYGDFNGDGLVDVAAVTSPTTIVVSLANPDGSYTASATLTAPKSQTIMGVTVTDVNGDGNLDVYAGGSNRERFYSHVWLGNGDGTFAARDTTMGRFPRWFV
jgi:FG-GAP-like repeat